MSIEFPLGLSKYTCAIALFTPMAAGGYVSVTVLAMASVCSAMIWRLLREVANSLFVFESMASTVPNFVSETAKLVGLISFDTPPEVTYSFPVFGLTTGGCLMVPLGTIGPSIGVSLFASKTQTGSFPEPHCEATHMRRFEQSKVTAAGQEPTDVEEIRVLLSPEYTVTFPPLKLPVQKLSFFISELTPADGLMVVAIVKLEPSMIVRLSPF